jgi:hypothetical protein
VSGHLPKKERPEPRPAIERANAGIAIVAGDKSFELGTRNQLDELGKYGRLRHGLKSSRKRRLVLQPLLNLRFQAFTIFMLGSEPDNSETEFKKEKLPEDRKNKGVQRTG